jgi:hypothetical protein
MIEKFTERDSLKLAGRETSLDGSEALFEGSDGPKRLGRQGLDRRAGVVEGTDVAKFDDLAQSPFLEPPKRQALRPAGVGTMFVDPAGPGLVEEGAGTRGMRSTGSEQRFRVLPNLFRLDREDRKTVNAAILASAPASEAAGVETGQE